MIYIYYVYEKEDRVFAAKSIVASLPSPPLRKFTRVASSFYDSSAALLRKRVIYLGFKTESLIVNFSEAKAIVNLKLRRN